MVSDWLFFKIDKIFLIFNNLPSITMIDYYFFVIMTSPIFILRFVTKKSTIVIHTRRQNKYVGDNSQIPENAYQFGENILDTAGNDNGIPRL